MLSFAQVCAGMLLLFLLAMGKGSRPQDFSFSLSLTIYSLLIILLGVCDVVSLEQVSFVVFKVVD